ncbi:hypothetical protein GCM10027074_56450 [Streptomyces deserti]
MIEHERRGGRPRVGEFLQRGQRQPTVLDGRTRHGYPGRPGRALTAGVAGLARLSRITRLAWLSGLGRLPWPP